MQTPPLPQIVEAPDTLNAVQAAALLFADPEIVMTFARKGELPGTKIGKQWVFLREDVLAFLRKRVIEDTAQRLRELDEKRKPPAVMVRARQKGRRREPPVLPGLPTNIQ